jgi:hypothetical protein
MTRTGRSFTVIDATGELAINSKPGMSLAEIEQWIVSRIRVRGAQLPAKRTQRGPSRRGQRPGQRHR